MEAKNISLYDLTGDMLTLMNMLYDEDVDEEQLFKVCNEIEMAIEDKADGYAMIINSIDGNIDSIKKEESRLKARRVSLENKQKWLKNNLYSSMKAIGKTKFKTALFSFGIQNNPPSVKVENESLFIEECQKSGRDSFLKYAEPVINKTALKNAILKDGEVIDGVEIVQTDGLRIR